MEAGTPRPATRDLRAAATSPLARRLSPKYLEEHCLLPLDIADDGRLTVAAGAQLDPTVVDELCLTYERPVKVVEVPAAEIHGAILSAQAESPVEASTPDLRDADLQVLAPEEEALDDLRALASQAPVIKLVNLTILEALKHRASDVHVESTAEGLRIRQRIDGVLHDVARHPRQYQAAVISRIKIMASLNIAERRVPQDGRVRLRLSDRELDLRVSTLPSVHGESVVLRILDRGAGVRDLGELGMEEKTRETFERLVTQPHGIILVSGPTGSGKTTTLYAALQRINTAGVKIITVEDPVEYQLDGLTQIPVNPKAGRTFATALRSILRHDPDIIMVGEMRDRETAEIAIQAALTGHLVFSTLHTNDAPSGITRLVDMGVEPYLVSATVQGLLAQRLMRVVCDACGEPATPSGEDRRHAADAGCPETAQHFRRGRGCDACAGTGYRGRTGVYELMVMTDGLRERVVGRSPLDELRESARLQGMIPLHQAAWAKAGAGITTPEEVFRVTRDEALA
ncbi:MAG: type II secretion system protein GspE [Gemmatimonadales bacterium]|nr:type II secretion system protein GspE [Gemmatimonadales bacterium]